MSKFLYNITDNKSNNLLFLQSNICSFDGIFLGNSRSIFRRFKLSRHICKKLSSNGFIIRLKKASF